MAWESWFARKGFLINSSQKRASFTFQEPPWRIENSQMEQCLHLNERGVGVAHCKGLAPACHRALQGLWERNRAAGSWFQRQIESEITHFYVMGNCTGTLVFPRGSCPWSVPLPCLPIGPCVCPRIGAQEAVSIQTAWCLIHSAVWAAPFQLSELDIDVGHLARKGCVSFFQCLNFIHLAAILSPLIHILSTLTPSCVLSGHSFNMHRLPWSACRCFEDVFFEASCPPVLDLSGSLWPVSGFCQCTYVYAPYILCKCDLCNVLSCPSFLIKSGSFI